MDLTTTIILPNEIEDYGESVKEAFLFSFNIFRPFLYGTIFDANNTILTILGEEPNKATPLWMVTGGEAINFYTAPEEKSRTKDLDVKLLLIDKYDIPRSFFVEERPELMKGLRGYIIKNHSDIFTKNGINPNVNMTELKNYLDSVITECLIKYFAPHPDYNLSSHLSFTSRKNILWSNLNFLDTSDGELMHISGKPGEYTITASVKFTDLDKHIDHLTTTGAGWYRDALPILDKTTMKQTVIAGIPKTKTTEFQLYICKTPFIITGTENEMYPYYVPFNEHGVYEVETGYDVFFENALRAFYTHPDREDIWDLYYRAISLMNIRRNLMSMGTLCVLVKKNKSKVCLCEGMLDLFIDFSAGSGPKGKKIYENKSLDGMIPNIIKTVTYCGRQSCFRLPTLNWLIYDQNRMLYHSLRGSDIGFRDWSDEGVTAWKEGNQGKHPKYFKKLKGLITTYYNVIDLVERKFNDPSLQPLMIEELKSCTGETNCSPSDFISYVYETLLPPTFISPEEEAYICPRLIPPPVDVFVAAADLKKTRKNISKLRGGKNRTKNVGN